MPSLEEDYIGVLPKVREVISEVVNRNSTDGILFSGGLDTSILAFELSKQKPVKAFTVVFEPGEAHDLIFAQKMASYLELNHIIRRFDFKEMVKAAEKIVKILKVFDPMEVRNSLSVIIGLEAAKTRGIESIMTGDGLDELFLGYPWLFDTPPNQLKTRMTKMWETMSFSSKPLGSALKIEIKTPFLDPLFKDFASTIDLKLKLNTKNGKKHGKWIIRKAYENLIPEEIIWREKIPLEQGTGTEILPVLFEQKMEDRYFEEQKKSYLRQDSVRILNKEQLFYYEIFRHIHGKPSEVYNKNGKQCPNCNAHVPKDASFCRVCGAYPINQGVAHSTA